MLYCDLTANSQAVFSGVPCMCGSLLKGYRYLPFVGNLMFTDIMGTSDPSYDGLGTRFLLLYMQEGTADVEIPLQAVPAQTLDIVLGDQNCTLAIYLKDEL